MRELIGLLRRGLARAGPTVLRVTLSGGLLYLLLRRTGLSEVGELLGGMFDDPLLVLVAVILPLAGSSVAAWRWRALLAGLGAGLRQRTLLAAILIGSFFNQFLPSTIGGDVVRSWWTREALGSPLVSLTVVAVDRAVGLVGFCLVGAVAAGLHPVMVREMPSFWWVLAGAAAATAAGVMAMHGEVAAAAGRLFRLPGLRTIRSRVGRVYRAVRAFRSEPGALGAALVMSVVIQGILILQYFVLAGAMGIPVSLGGLAVVIPLVTLVSLLPVTINGIGLREGALAALGASIGLSAGDAIALAWAFLCFQLVWAMVGGLLYLVLGRPRVAPAADFSMDFDTDRVPAHGR